MASTLTHSSLGEIRGKADDGVIQFWGIKYASIKDIFAPSEITKGSCDNVIDATQLGYVLNYIAYSIDSRANDC